MKDDSNTFAVLGENLDTSKIPNLNQKRILAFLNHFIQQTVIFLNRFANDCEFKLNDLAAQINRASDNLSILESKLNSIDGVDIGLPETLPEIEVPLETKKEPQVEEKVNHEQEIAAVVNNPISKDARFMPYFKMVAVGVPIPAVKIKMSTEGLDPSLLDDPDAPAPPIENRSESSALESDASW